jgi:integrase
MALKLYRRHRKECEGCQREDARTGEFEESRRGWKKCQCLIHAVGSLRRVFKRRSTGKMDWAEAKAVAAAWEAAGIWPDDEVEVQPVVADPIPQAPSRTTIERAVTTFLDELREHAAGATHKKYRLLLKKFRTFSEKRGYVMIDQWEPLDVREFRSSWNVAPGTAVRNMAMLKPFFEWCLNNEWITRNPARLVKNPKGREVKREEQKLPFTDEELKRMYDACKIYGAGDPRYVWKGDDLSDFISLSIYTGLRISDVALFHIDRMLPTGEILIRTTKAGTNVYTWVPQWLQQRIRQRAETHGPYIFGSHQTKTLEVITEGWRRKLKRLWKLCGPWKERPSPHRFRHTFARVLLQKDGVTVRDVAELLGNTEDMIRKHYGAWVPERQARLTKILKQAFDGKPRPKLVPLKGGRSQ